MDLQLYGTSYHLVMITMFGQNIDRGRNRFLTESCHLPSIVTCAAITSKHFHIHNFTCPSSWDSQKCNTIQCHGYDFTTATMMPVVYEKAPLIVCITS